MSLYTIFLTTDSDGISIDGDFSDWDDTPMVVDPAEDSESNSADITRVGMETGTDYLYFYVSTQGDMFQGTGSEGDTMRIFMDSDSDRGTGYAISGIGADYLIEVYGVNNEIFSSNYYEYYNQHRNDQDQPRTQYDWSAWAPMFRVDSDVDGNQMEAKLWDDELRIPENVLPSILVQITDPNDFTDESPVFTMKGAISTDVVGKGYAYLAPGSSHEFLDVTLTNNGEDNVLVSGISFLQTSTLTTDDVNSVELIYGEEIISGTFTQDMITFEDLEITVATELSLSLKLTLTDEAQAGHGIVIQLDDIETDAGVTIQNTKVSSYITSAPENPVIDGLFGDWIEPKTDRADDVENQNVDITEYDARNHESSTYFYLQVAGQMLTGKAIPTGRAMNIPIEGSDDQGEVQDDSPLPAESGEDTIYIFLDTFPGTGYNSIYIPFGADFMIKITGQNGFIHSSEYYVYDDETEFQDTWSWQYIESIDSASDGSEIEAVVNEEPISTYFHMVSWDDSEDYSSNVISDDGLTPGGIRAIQRIGSNNEELGHSIATGDFNNDGNLDLAAGVPGYNSDRGGVRIYYGDGTGISSTSDILIRGFTTGNRVGEAIAVGNFDGENDGDDLAIGSPNYDSTKGRVFIFEEGGTNMAYAYQADIVLNGGGVTGQKFGSSIISGDFDGDGDASDIAIGAPEYNPNKFGAVYIYYDPSPSTSSFDQRFLGQANIGEYSGFSLAKGDFDNDGDAEDIVIGAPAWSNEKGRVKIYEDSLDTATPTIIYSTSIDNQRFGEALAVGDLDDGGYDDDLLIGAPNYASQDTGRVYLYYDASGNATIFAQDTNGNNQKFGTSIAIGDIQGDGNDDIVIGAPGYNTANGRLFVYYGGESPINTYDITKVGTLGMQVGHVVTTGMIVDNSWNGDDIIVGAPGYGTNDGGLVRIYENEDDLGIPEFNAIVVPTIGILGLFALIRRKRK